MPLPTHGNYRSHNRVTVIVWAPVKPAAHFRQIRTVGIPSMSSEVESCRGERVDEAESIGTAGLPAFCLLGPQLPVQEDRRLLSCSGAENR